MHRNNDHWSIRRQKIEIYQFHDERYVLVQQSQFFPRFGLNAIFSDCISEAD
ncbi:hypothetical protein [Coleofasciculus sp. FACHB-129]|uniref:hypothetical protein n=1 Tax=Cyanophyceae TaxID=3028117 RepID=UPI0016873279|nr:hypothetical protein [Coleofasciculus sp. FACHB-129]MBD1898318.1 hypothetical protein [Coleofasciculus sp. FACHB-129]